MTWDFFSISHFVALTNRIYWSRMATVASTCIPTFSAPLLAHGKFAATRCSLCNFSSVYLLFCQPSYDLWDQNLTSIPTVALPPRVTVHNWDMPICFVMFEPGYKVWITKRFRRSRRRYKIHTHFTRVKPSLRLWLSHSTVTPNQHNRKDSAAWNG